MVITIYYKVKQFARFDAFINGGFQGKYSSIVLKTERLSRDERAAIFPFIQLHNGREAVLETNLEFSTQPTLLEVLTELSEFLSKENRKPSECYSKIPEDVLKAFWEAYLDGRYEFANILIMYWRRDG